MRPPDLPSPMNIGISISDSPDMWFFGFTDKHLKNAMAGFAIHLLASGATLAYGGDLMDRGFTRLIFEFVMRTGHAKRSCRQWPTTWLGQFMPP